MEEQTREKSSLKEFYYQHPYRRFLAKYLIVIYVIVAIIGLSLLILPNNGGWVRIHGEMFVFIVGLVSIFSILFLWWIPLYVAIYPKPSRSMKELEPEFMQTYQKYVGTFSESSVHRRFHRLKLLLRFSLILFLLSIALGFIGFILFQPGETALQAEIVETIVFGSFVGMLCLSLIIFLFSIDPYEKAKLEDQLETQKQFLEVYKSCSMQFSYSLEAGIKILTEPTTPLDLEISQFISNANQILYYRVLARFFVTYIFVPFLMSLAVLFPISEASGVELYLTIGYEIVWVIAVVGLIRKTAHCNRMNENTRLILGLNMKTTRTREMRGVSDDDTYFWDD